MTFLTWLLINCCIIINRDLEPLKTLRSFRQADMLSDKLKYLKPLYKDSPLFGNNMALDVAGEVSVGDVVYIGEYV
jgi:hypothetical protein